MKQQPFLFLYFACLYGAASSVPAIPEVIKFAASPSGSYVAYVAKGETREGAVRQEVWLKDQEGKERRLFSSDQLEGINYAYASRVTALAWSPSERFLSVSVSDGDVSVRTAVYDLRKDQWQVLVPNRDPKDPNVQDSWDAQWHPSQDVLFFRANDSLSDYVVLYRYDARKQTKAKTHLEGGLREYQPVRAGLVLRLAGRGTDPDRLMFLPYTSFR